MNSKIFLPLLFSFLILQSSCGVKSDPVPPKGTQLPSYVDKFLQQQDKTDSDKDDQDKKAQ